MMDAATESVAAMGSSAGMPSSPSAWLQRIAALCDVACKLAQRRPSLRRERLSGLHNPWGLAAALTSAWPFLDLCEDGRALDAVAECLGPDIVLWDSELHLQAEAYLRFVVQGREGCYWPVEPLAGAVVLVALDGCERAPLCFDVNAIACADLSALNPSEPLYVVRYMPGTSRFVRDPRAAPNWRAMEEQPLLNYTGRPLWLVRGEDRAGNDFVTGFAPAVPRWAAAPQPKEN